MDRGGLVLPSSAIVEVIVSAEGNDDDEWWMLSMVLTTPAYRFPKHPLSFPLVITASPDLPGTHHRSFQLFATCNAT